MSAWAVRPATRGDAPALVALVRRFALEGSDRESPLTAPELKRLAFGARPRFSIMLAELDGQPVGYALYYPSFDTEHAAQGCYLQDLFVAPEARRLGIGRALMAAVARACQDDGGCYLFWNALASNDAGRAFYRALGAREEPVVTLSLQPHTLRRLAEG